jgi:hypothetical protein
MSNYLEVGIPFCSCSACDKKRERQMSDERCRYGGALCCCDLCLRFADHAEKCVCIHCSGVCGECAFCTP